MTARVLARCFRGVAWAVLVFLVAPVLVVYPVSVTPNRWLSLPSGGISFSHYLTLVQEPEWLDAFEQSLVIAVIVMTVATVIGTAAAIATWRLSHPLVKSMKVVVLLPLIVPPVVSALGMYRVWVDLGIFDSLIGTVLAHTIMASPFVFVTVSASLASVDPRIEQASRTLGASAFHTALNVIVPSIRPGIMAGAVFAFITSWDEVVVTLFVTARHVFTLPRKIFQDLHDNIDPAVAAVSALMITATLIIAGVLLARSLRRTEDPAS